MAQKTFDERFRLTPPTRSPQDRHAWMTSEERRFILWGVKEAWPAARIGRVLGVNEATVRRFRARFQKNPQLLLDLGLCEMVGRAKDEEYRCLVCAEQIIARPAIERHILRHFVGESAVRLALTAREDRQADLDSQADSDGPMPTRISTSPDRLDKENPSDPKQSLRTKIDVERPLSSPSIGPLDEAERTSGKIMSDRAPDDQLSPGDRDSQIAEDVGLGDGLAGADDSPQSPDHGATPSDDDAAQPRHQRDIPGQHLAESESTRREPSRGDDIPVSAKEDPSLSRVDNIASVKEDPSLSRGDNIVSAEKDPSSIGSLVEMALSRIAKRREELEEFVAANATDSDAASSHEAEPEDTAETQEMGEGSGPDAPLPAQIGSQPIGRIAASDMAGKAETYRESESVAQGTGVKETPPIALPSQVERPRTDLSESAVEVPSHTEPPSQPAIEQPEAASPSGDFEFGIEKPDGPTISPMPSTEVEDDSQRPEPTTEDREPAAKVPQPEIERIVGEPVSFELSGQFGGPEPELGSWHEAFNRLATQRGVQGPASTPDEDRPGKPKGGRSATDAALGKASGEHQASGQDADNGRLEREKRLRDFERVRQIAMQASQQKTSGSAEAISGPTDPSPGRPSDTADQEWEDEL